MENRFDIAAQTWDTTPTTLQLSEAIVSKLHAQITFTDSMHVLDYGAGTGLVLFSIQALVHHITAVDTSQGMRNVLQQKIINHRITNVTISDIDIQSTKLPVNTYDVFVSSMTLHHIQNTIDFFEKAYQSLTKGGKLALFDLVTEDGSFHKQPDSSIHHLGFHPHAIANIMESVGFTYVSVSEFYTLPKEGALYPIFAAFGTKK